MERNNRNVLGEGMNEDVVATFNYNLTALKLEFKTTCDALRNWPGGAAEEQDFLQHKKQELFRALMEHSYDNEVV